MSNADNASISTLSLPMPAHSNKLNQTWCLLVFTSDSYCKAMEILEWNASSNDFTRLVVKNMTPLWYSRSLRKIPTIAFLCMSLSVLFSRNMSASSRSITASQWHATSRMFLSLLSKSEIVVPNSPTVIPYKGFCNNSLIASAVSVLPVPGGPCSKKIHPPPLPPIISLKHPL